MSKHQTANKVRHGQTKGMINAFICPDLHCTITKNVDDGFTPQAVGCPTCGQEAESRGYNVNQQLNPVIEWFRPSEAEMQASMLSKTPKDAEAYKNYIVLQKGLISRPIAQDKKFTEKS